MFKSAIRNRLPILTYHSLDDSSSPISIAPARFRSQMEYLRAMGWRTRRLNELLAGRARGEWDARTLVLTFDDGYQNFFEHALPILNECGFTATVFLVSDFVGRTNDWRGQPRWVPRLRLMDWANSKRIVEAGMEIGAHSCTHPHLTRLPLAEAEREIAESQQAIENQLGCAVVSFAYPYGESSLALETIVSENFRAGFGTHLGFANSHSRATCFERIDMYYLRDPRFFHALNSGWIDSYLRVRGWIRKARGQT